MRLPKKNTKLADVRQATGLSMMKIAFMLGVSNTQFWKIENGYIEPSDKIKAAIAKILNVDVSSVF